MPLPLIPIALVLGGVGVTGLVTRQAAEDIDKLSGVLFKAALLGGAAYVGYQYLTKKG